MKTKLLSLLFASSLLAVGICFVRGPNPVQADDIPEQYRESVLKGLNYLATKQRDDGRWEGNKGQNPVAMTGLVGLAFLMEKNNQSRSPVEAKYAANIRKAADWLMSKSQPGRDGLIFSEHPSETTRYMQGHGLATLFLAGALKVETDAARQKKLFDVIQRAVQYIVKAQSSQGGWYQTSKVEGHDFATISDTVIQIQALQAVETSSFVFPREAIKDGQTYVKAALGKLDADTKSEPNLSRQADTAAALATRVITRPWTMPPQDEVVKHWLAYCQKTIPTGRAVQFGRDELIHYYYAQALFSIGGETWTTYRTALFDHLQSSQNKDGSWPTSEGISVGQVYATALWCTVLQLDKGSHPSRQLGADQLIVD